MRRLWCWLFGHQHDALRQVVNWSWASTSGDQGPIYVRVCWRCLYIVETEWAHGPVYVVNFRREPS